MEFEPLETELVTRPKTRTFEPEQKSQSSDSDLADIGPALAGPANAIGADAVIGLQRTAGNAATTALLQRKMAEAEEEEGSASPVLEVVGKGGGEPLNDELREEMEGRLGDDFSDVRVHTDSEAARSAAAVSARAYTVGHEIVLGEGAPALDSDQGKHTLAHELTHVTQQRNGPVAGTATGDGISISDPSDRFEQAAEHNATQATSDLGPEAHAPAGSTAGPGLAQAQRAPADEEEQEAETEELVEPELPEEESETGEEEEEAPVQGLFVQRDEEEETEAEVAENAEEMEQETEADEAAEETEEAEEEAETEQEEAQAEADNEAQEAEEEAG